MATIRKNPGNPFKVATKMLKSATGRVKTAVKNTQKTSTRKTTSSSSAPVTGKSRVNTKLMDAATKNLPNVTVKAKRQPVSSKTQPTKKGVGRSTVSYVQTGNTRDAGRASALSKLPAMDSTAAMNLMKSEYRKKGFSSNPQALYSMKKIQAKYPDARFSDFRFNKQTGDFSFKHTTSKPTYTKTKMGKIKSNL